MTKTPDLAKPDATSSVDAKPPPDRLVRWSIIAFVAVLVLLGAYGTYRMILRTTVKTRLAEMKDAGFVLTLEELNASYADPPAGRNAVDLYVLAFASHVDPGEAVSNQIPHLSSVVDSPENHEPLPPEMLEAMATYIASNGRCLELIAEAQAFDQSRYDIDLREGFATLLPHLGQMRQLARMLGVKAQLHTERGELDEAITTIESVLHLADSLRNEPVLISQLVRVSIHALAIGELERALSRAQFSDEALQSLQSRLHETFADDRPQDIVVKDMCSGLDLFSEPSKVVAEATQLPAPVIYLYRAGGLGDFDQLEYLDIMMAMRAAGDESPTRMPAAMDAIESRVESLPRQYLVTRALVPALGGSLRTFNRIRARLHAAEAAIAVERYRAAHGTLPASLDDLVPTYLDAVPIDPYSGDPLKFTLQTNGYATYCVGEDGKDDGGASDNRCEPDVAFKVER